MNFSRFTPTVSIIGLGWFGLPLAQKLASEGYSVKGSTTNSVKEQQLNQKKEIPTYLFSISGPRSFMTSPLFEAQRFVINIPPSALSTFSTDEQLDRLEDFIEVIDQHHPEGILLVSSTSVYGKSKGQCDESTSVDRSSERSKSVLRWEDSFQAHFKESLTILRFGGLYGKNRHPVRYLSGRTGLSSPNAPVNLVHLEDCIGVTSKILERDQWGEVYNVVSDDHPTRRHYYQTVAQQLGLDLPQFVSSGGENEKVILNEKLKTQLNYSFLHPSPLSGIG